MADSPARTVQRTVADWTFRHPYLVLSLLTVAMLAPFLSKPFNLDDPLYIWAAQQIQVHPGNPYGFEVNWFGIAEPMWSATQNPPAMSYYLAGAAGIFGWGEIGLHLAGLLPAVAVVLGTYRLARNFCRWPRFAALAVLCSPGFLVSSTTVMCDVAMLAAWVWAVVFWMEGLKQNSRGKLWAAGILTGLGLLTKYNGICLIPLLAAYGLMEKRRPGGWLGILLIPVAALGASEWWTFHLYGHPHFLASNQYATASQTYHGISSMFKALNALTFTGGSFALVFFCAPCLWSKKGLLILTTLGGLLVALALTGGMMTTNFSWLTGNLRVGTEIQIILWSVAGVFVLALAVADGWQNKTSGSWLLALWVLGVFAFAAFIYWMVNIRAILPMAPAVAILVTRRLEQDRLKLTTGIKISLVASAALSLLLASADFQLANAVRKGAERVHAEYASRPGRKWFSGHWGFQYYMQLWGAWPLGFNRSALKPADLVIVPVQYANQTPVAPPDGNLIEVCNLPVCPWLAIWNPSVGAGFYSASTGGPLPFVFGNIPPEKLFVYVLQEPAGSAR